MQAFKKQEEIQKKRIPEWQRQGQGQLWVDKEKEQNYKEEERERERTKEGNKENYYLLRGKINIDFLR